MDSEFHGKEGMGPGSYLGHEIAPLSRLKSNTKFSVPKNDRGLLTQGKQRSPGPGDYGKQYTQVKKHNPAFSMGGASRDIPFSKYAS